MKLSIIVPVYNEAKTILEILNRVEAVNFGVEREIIVIDDGSTDGTTQLLKSLTHADNTRTNAENKNDKLLYEDLTYKIRGAAFNVRKKIGLGHKEIIYQKALEEEFRSLRLNFKKEEIIDIRYNDKKIGIYQPDFIIEDKIILEIKALPFIGQNEKKQIWTYLKGSEYKLALLVNFAYKDVQIGRVVYETARSIPHQSASSQRKSALKVIFQKKNEGKGAAMRRGFEEAKGEIIVIQDADLEYNPEELPKLVQPILDGRAEAVYGRRIITENQPHYALFAWGNKCLSLLFYLLYGRVIHDPSAGYKLFKKSILADLNLKSAKGFDVESELTSKILKYGYKIIEMPVHYQPRTYSQGKKIKWGDGLRLAWTIVKFRFID